MLKTRTKPLAVMTVLLALVAICNVGCEDLLREASYFFDDVADTLDDVADDWDHDDDWEDTVDDILDDIEDWFD